MQVLATKEVKGYQVVLTSNGGVYFGRDLFNLIRNDLQGVQFTAKTPREFDDVCRLLAL